LKLWLLVHLPLCSPDSSSGCCHNSLRMSRCTASFSIVSQPILTLRIPLLTSRSPAYHCGHLNWVIGIVVATCAFQSAHLPDLAIHYNTLRAVKEQSDVTSYIPCILSLACNWSIDHKLMHADCTKFCACYRSLVNNTAKLKDVKFQGKTTFQPNYMTHAHSKIQTSLRAVHVATQ